MAVLVEGMEMPEGCSYCMFRHTSFMTGLPICTLINEAIPDGVNWGERLPECKMIEVPEPHGELIDRHEAYLRFGKLAETLEEKNGYEAGAPYAMAALFLNNVEEFPTIIPASQEG